MYVNGNNVTYSNSTGVEHIPPPKKQTKKTKKIMGNKNYYSMYLQNTSIQFINEQIFLHYIYWLMLKNKILLDYINLFSVNEYVINVKIISKYC